MCGINVYSWEAEERNVKGLLDPDKEQSMEMKSVVAAANDAIRPA